ncbi:hypothetical protein DFH08DRAFT_1019525, partial [Mycena albidolilacea]
TTRNRHAHAACHGHGHGWWHGLHTAHGKHERRPAPGPLLDSSEPVLCTCNNVRRFMAAPPHWSQDYLCQRNWFHPLTLHSRVHQVALHPHCLRLHRPDQHPDQASICSRLKPFDRLYCQHHSTHSPDCEHQNTATAICAGACRHAGQHAAAPAWGWECDRPPRQRAPARVRPSQPHPAQFIQRPHAHPCPCACGRLFHWRCAPSRTKPDPEPPTACVHPMQHL